MKRSIHARSVDVLIVSGGVTDTAEQSSATIEWVNHAARSAVITASV